MINLHDNDFVLLTWAVNQRYRLGFFPYNLKQKVVMLLKSEIKNHCCCETGQSGQVLKFFCRSILCLNRKQKQTLTKVSNMIQLVKSLRQKLLFLAEENFSSGEIKEAEVLSWWNSNKKNTHTSCKVYKKVSFGTTIFCLFWKVISEAG